MTKATFTILSFVVMCLMTSVIHAADDESQVRAADTRFWQAYNACDMNAMGDLITGDVEFYHDKSGLTTTRQGLLDSLRKGPCADPKMRLRREAVDEAIKFYPLKGGFAILSGRHRFYVDEAGKPERLDGQADFTTVWKQTDGTWRMHRVLSYDHGPVAYVPPARTLKLPAATLATYAGHYSSARIGDIVVVVDGDHLKLTAGGFVATLYPESVTRFFAMEKDLRFDFEKGTSGKPGTMAVYENGAVSERAQRID